MVHINYKKCEELALLLKRIDIPLAQEEGHLGAVKEADLPNLYFFLVAICHQTSPVGKPRVGGLLATGEEYYGWDYLRRRFAEAVKTNKALVDPKTWVSITTEQVRTIFADAEGRETLSDLEGRSKLIRELGLGCRRSSISTLDELYMRCGGWLS